MQQLIQNARGFAHHLVLAALVIGVAIGGTYYLVASHADTCGTSSPTSSPATSDPASAPCNPTTAPVTSPVSSPVSYAASCAISGVPASVKTGTTINPMLTITNKGTLPYAPSMLAFFQRTGGPAIYFNPVTAPSIAPGAKTTVALGSYTITTNLATPARVHAQSNKKAVNTHNVVFSCSRNFQVTAAS